MHPYMNVELAAAVLADKLAAARIPGSSPRATVRVRARAECVLGSQQAGLSTPPAVNHQPIVLGPQSNPTTLGSIAGMDPGTYLVQQSVGVVTGPSDGVVCAAGDVPFGNDGLFGGVNLL